MPKHLSTDEIRRRWVAFFQDKEHLHVASDSLVPQNDPSVLFTGAGMNQFKEHFLSRAKLAHPRQRAVTAQKCVRAGDIDNVGRTASHHTFFEMLGNFSFGDYFKDEAILWAAEFLLDPNVGLGLEPERLSVTVFGGNAALGIARDEEAVAAWQRFAPWLKDDRAPDGWRIYGYGEHDNFWPADAPSQGPNGPCGPCSEIYYDMRPGAPPTPAADDSARYCEIWNLVFTQFDRRDGGQLVPLPQKNIDTGAGLERMARVIQGKATNFETDLLYPIVQTVARLAGKDYEKVREGDDGRRMRRISDHVRMAVFAISDGAPPKNEGRNYVVRRLMRRAILDGQELGIGEPFLAEVGRAVVQQMKVGYPELVQRQETTLRIVEEEERNFDRTLAQGSQQFNEVMERLKAAGQKNIPGADAFRLWDTFGFPIELTTEQAEALGFTVDLEGFKQAREEAAKRSQAGSDMSREIFASGPVAELKRRYAGHATKFVGYETLYVEGARVLALIQGDALVETAQPGDATVLLDQTSFYGESGGQVGDKGCLRVGAGGIPRVALDRRTPLHVLDTQKQEGLILHVVKLNAPLHGGLHVGDIVAAEVDPAHRLPTVRNHSATHLLHYALRAKLGTHVEQRGSLVSPERLRFDFTHFEALTEEQLREVETLANSLILEDHEIHAEEKTISEARAAGAMALFGEKYGERVRMITMGPSRELCGGTHAQRTGQIGYLRIIAEGSISAGVRRIEALTGEAAVADARCAEAELDALAARLKARRDGLLQRIEDLLEEGVSLRRELEAARRKAAQSAAGELLSAVRDVKGAKLLAAPVPDADAAGLRTTLDGIRRQLPAAVVVLGGVKEGKVALLVSVAPELVKRGAHAGLLLKALAPLVGGKGGGKPEMAQGGGADAARLPEALAAAEGLLAAMLK